MALLGFTLPPDSGEKLTLGKFSDSTMCADIFNGSPGLHPPPRLRREAHPIGRYSDSIMCADILYGSPGLHPSPRLRREAHPR